MTAKDIGQNAGQTVPSRYEDKHPYCDVEVSTREDPEVKDKDGAFGEPGGSAVEDGGDKIQLFDVQVSTGPRMSRQGLSVRTLLNAGERYVAGTSHMCFPRPQLSTVLVRTGPGAHCIDSTYYPM